MFSKNPERNSAAIWLVISTGALVLAFIFATVFLVGHFTFGRFFPVMLLPLLAFVGLIICASLYGSSRKRDAILSGKDGLARWTYQPEEIALYVTEAQKKEDNAKYIVLAVCLFMLLLASAFAYDKNGWDLAAIAENALLFLITAIFIFVVLPAMDDGPSNATEFYLARNGALFAGRFHIWQAFGMRLETVNFKEGKPAMLEIIYSVITENGSQNTSLQIPVPNGKENEALDAAKKLATGK